jgi:hypothetical protein
MLPEGIAAGSRINTPYSTFKIACSMNDSPQGRKHRAVSQFEFPIL